jgi:hypothetical protein
MPEDLKTWKKAPAVKGLWRYDRVKMASGMRLYLVYETKLNEPGGVIGLDLCIVKLLCCPTTFL